MNYFILLLLALLQGFTLAAVNCGAGNNNCQRAVIASASSPAVRSSRKNDCSSFFSYTVYPAASTSTITSTVTARTSTTLVTQTTTMTVTSVSTSIILESTTLSRPPRRRQVTGGAITVSPTRLPAFASACSGVAAFSSACSCLNIQKMTTTAPTPTFSTTVYVSITPGDISTTVNTIQATTTTVTATTSIVTACPPAMLNNGVSDGIVILDYIASDQDSCFATCRALPYCENSSFFFADNRCRGYRFCPE